MFICTQSSVHYMFICRLHIHTEVKFSVFFTYSSGYYIFLWMITCSIQYIILIFRIHYSDYMFTLKYITEFKCTLNEKINQNSNEIPAPAWQNGLQQYQVHQLFSWNITLKSHKTQNSPRMGLSPNNRPRHC